MKKIDHVKRYTAEEKSRAVELLRDGHTYAEVTEKTGICRAVLYHEFKKHYPVDRRRRYSQQELEDAIEMLRHSTYVEVMMKTGIAHGALQKAKKRAVEAGTWYRE